MTGNDATQRTRTLARIVGPYMLIAGVALFLRRGEVADLFAGFMQNPSLLFVSGAFTLMVGLVMIAAHHHWSSAAAIVISLVGIAAALKGATLMAFPQHGAEMTDALLRQPLILTIAALIDAAVGAWLTFTGWFAGSRTNP